MKRRLLASIGLTFLLVPFAAAHDLWLVPPASSTPVGSAVEVVVSSGMDFPVSAHAADPERLTVRVRGPAGQELPTALRKDEEHLQTLVRFEPNAPGAWIVAVTTRPNVLPQEAADFNEYLLHDGLPHVLAGRMERGELDRAVVERYSKNAKALVSVGEPAPQSAGATAPSDGAATAVLGLDLEIVLSTNPLHVSPGETLSAQVLFRGQPLEHANLCWDHPANGADFSGQTWTDAAGQALVPIARSGPMTLRLVHMTRPATAEYEWESFWASYTFHIAPAK